MLKINILIILLINGILSNVSISLPYIYIYIHTHIYVCVCMRVCVYIYKYVYVFPVISKTNEPIFNIKTSLQTYESV